MNRARGNAGPLLGPVVVLVVGAVVGAVGAAEAIGISKFALVLCLLFGQSRRGRDEGQCVCYLHKIFSMSHSRRTRQSMTFVSAGVTAHNVRERWRPHRPF